VVDSGRPVGILTDRDVALALADYPDVVSRPMGDVMTKGVVTVPPDATIEDILVKFIENGVSRLLVVDASGQLLGIVARTDIASSLVPSS
jgi:CBS domain-containing protein